MGVLVESGTDCDETGSDDIFRAHHCTDYTPRNDGWEGNAFNDTV